MTYEISGKVDEILDTKRFNSGFCKRDIVINASDEKSKYPNILKFTAKKDRCSSLDELHRGDEVKIVFAVNGHTWDGPKGRQVFNDLIIVRISKIGSESVGGGEIDKSCEQDTGFIDNSDMPF